MPEVGTMSDLDLLAAGGRDPLVVPVGHHAHYAKKNDARQGEVHQPA